MQPLITRAVSAFARRKTRRPHPEKPRFSADLPDQTSWPAVCSSRPPGGLRILSRSPFFRSLRWGLFIAVSGVAMGACDEKLSDLTGPTPNLQPTLSSIQSEIFSQRCIGCHNGAGRFLPGVMNLTEGNAYASLVGVPSIEKARRCSAWPPAIPRTATSSTSWKAGRDHRRPHAVQRHAADRWTDSRDQALDRTRRAEQLRSPHRDPSSSGLAPASHGRRGRSGRRRSRGCAPGAHLAARRPAAPGSLPAPDAAPRSHGDARPVPAEEERDDAVLNRSQPDFTLINLPTGLRLPKWKSAFRVTHRFTRPLGEGDFGDLAEDFFGLDSGAIIGLEFRIGIAPGTQVGVHRTNDRTIQFFGQYDVKQQSDSFPLGIAAYATIDGTDNFTDSYSPSLGADRHARVRRARRDLRRADLGEQHATSCRPEWSTTTTRSCSASAAASASARPSTWSPRSCRGVGGFDPGSTADQLRDREARRRPRVPAGVLEQLRADDGAGRARRRREHRRQRQLVLGFNISRKFF